MREEQARRGSLGIAIDSFSSQLGVPGSLSEILGRRDGKLHISVHVYLVQSLRRHHNPWWRQRNGIVIYQAISKKLIQSRNNRYRRCDQAS